MSGGAARRIARTFRENTGRLVTGWKGLFLRGLRRLVLVEEFHDDYYGESEGLSPGSIFPGLSGSLVL